MAHNVVYQNISKNNLINLDDKEAVNKTVYKCCGWICAWLSQGYKKTGVKRIKNEKEQKVAKRFVWKYLVKAVDYLFSVFFLYFLSSYFLRSFFIKVDYSKKFLIGDVFGVWYYKCSTNMKLSNHRNQCGLPLVIAFPHQNLFCLCCTQLANFDAGQTTKFVHKSMQITPTVFIKWVSLTKF